MYYENHLIVVIGLFEGSLEEKEGERLGVERELNWECWEWRESFCLARYTYVEWGVKYDWWFSRNFTAYLTMTASLGGVCEKPKGI